MRKSLLFTFAVILLLTMGSCGKSTKNQPTLGEMLDSVSQIHMEMSQQDSAEVYSLVNEYLDKLRQDKIDEAVGMIYFLNKKREIVNLPEPDLRRSKAMLTRFKGVKYDLDRIVYDQETDNIAKYTVTLFEKETGDPRPNTISFMLKPIRRDGKWYLTYCDDVSGNGTNLPN
jgi:hypothetical protein